MSDAGGKSDPVVQAAARLEAAVERLAEALGGALAARGAETSAHAADMVPRAEVAALAQRLDSTITRLRGALAEELRHAEDD
jgi:hypothetical protein